MGLLSVTELAELREEFEETLDQTATVSRKTRGANVGGSKSVSYVEFGEYLCRVQDRIVSSREGTSEGRETGTIPVTIVFPHDADIRQTDQLEIDGSIFEVVGAIPVRSERLTNTITAVLVS